MHEGTRWLTADERRVWMSFVATVSLLEAALDRQLQRDAGIPLGYYQILAMLSEAKDRTLRMSDLAVATQSSQSRLSHAVSRLERNGWVRRLPCPDDRRSTLAQLTGAGFDALVAAAPGHVRSVRESLFDQLSPDQVGQLHDICAAVLARLARTPAARADRPHAAGGG